MIKLLWPTVRPSVALTAANDWLSKSTDPANVEIIFGVNKQEHVDVLGHHAYLFESARPGVTATATCLTRLFGGKDKDIIVLASDDFTCEKGWDAHLEKEYENFDGALIVNDGYKIGTNIIPIPVVCGSFLSRLNGIAYHPAYNHFFSDEELFYVVQEIGNVKDLRGTKSPLFAHKHWSFGGRKKDDFDNRNNKWWDADKKMFELRKSWPLEKKLELTENFK